jgi:hypothetical protein
LVDTVILNVDLANDGTLRSRNAGQMLVAGLKVWQWYRPYAVSIGHQNAGGAMHFEPYGAQGMVFADCHFDTSAPGQNLTGANNHVSRVAAISIAA